jgi:hypothetical protein
LRGCWEITKAMFSRSRASDWITSWPKKGLKLIQERSSLIRVVREAQAFQNGFCTLFSDHGRSCGTSCGNGALCLVKFELRFIDSNGNCSKLCSHRHKSTFEFLFFPQQSRLTGSHSRNTRSC